MGPGVAEGEDVALGDVLLEIPSNKGAGGRSGICTFGRREGGDNLVAVEGLKMSFLDAPFASLYRVIIASIRSNFIL